MIAGTQNGFDPVAPIASLFSVAGLVLPAWIFADAKSWTAVVAGWGDFGGPAFLGDPVEASCAMLAAAPSMAFPRFGQPGAALEFLRLLGVASRRTGRRSLVPGPMGLWRAPAASFSARPACPRHGRADPIDMSRLAARLAYVWESSQSHAVPEDFGAMVAASVVSEDVAGRGFYDPAFSVALEWMDRAATNPQAAFLSLYADTQKASVSRDPFADFFDGATFASLAAARPVRRRLATAKPPSIAALAKTAGKAETALSSSSEVLAAGALATEAIIRAVPTSVAPKPMVDVRMPRLSDPDFDPRIVAGVDLAGLSLHAHEITSEIRSAAVDDSSGDRVRTYLTLITVDPVVLDSGGLFDFLRGKG